jgi:hypothetical protein
MTLLSVYIEHAVAVPVAVLPVASPKNFHNAMIRVCVLQLCMHTCITAEDTTTITIDTPR